MLRETHGPVHASALDAAWAGRRAARGCLAGLVADGLVARVGPATYSLP